MNIINFRNSLQTFVNSTRQEQLDYVNSIHDLITSTYQTMVDVTIELRNYLDMLAPIRQNLDIEVEFYNRIRELLIDFIVNYNY